MDKGKLLGHDNTIKKTTMKRKLFNLRIPAKFAMCLLAVLAAAAGLQTVQATTATWNGAPAGGTFSWSLGTNWTGGVPNGIDDVANLNNVDLTTATTIINLDGTRTIGTLNIGDTTNATAFGYTINAYGSSGRLVFDVSTGTAAINVIATSAANTFNVPIVLNDDTVMTLVSSGAAQQPGVQTINGNISGTGKFTITSGGGFHNSSAPSTVANTTLSGINTNTGGIEVQNVRFNPTTTYALSGLTSVLDGGQLFMAGGIGAIRANIKLEGLGFNESGQGGLGALRTDAANVIFGNVTATSAAVRIAGNGAGLGGTYYGTLGETGGARNYDFGRWANAGATMTGASTIASSLAYTGKTYISSGSLIIGQGGTLGDLGTTSDIVFGFDNKGNNSTFTQTASSATLQFNRADNVTLTKAITQTLSTDTVPVLMTGNLSHIGLGVLTLDNGTSGYTGTTTVSGVGGKLAVGTGGAYNFSGLGNITISNGADLEFNTSSTVQIGGGGTVGTTTLPLTQILTTPGSGGQQFIQNGSGQLILSGSSDNSAAHLVVNSGSAVFNKHTTNQSASVGSGNELGLIINGGAITYGADALSNQIFGFTDVRMTGGSVDMVGKSDGIDVLTGNVGTWTNSSLTLSNLQLGGDTLATTVVNSQNSNLNTGYAPIGNNVLWNGAGVYQANFGGAITGNIALNKLGTGLQTLSGANTFTGGTTITGGTLSVTGSLTGAVSVPTAGTLSGTGSVGAVTMAAGGSIRPGALALDHSVGTLTIDTLTVNGGDSRFNLGANPVSGNDKVVVTNTANFAVGATVSTSFFAPPTAGTYTLLTAGTLSGTLPTYTAPLNTRYTSFTLDPLNTTPGALTLTIVGSNGSNAWTGGSGNWLPTGASANWTLGDFKNLDTATFGNNGNITATLTGNVEAPITFANTTPGTNDVTIAGASILTGLTSISKTGDGLLTISGAHDFYGNVNVNSGTLKIGTGGVAAAGPLGNQAGQTFVASGATIDLNGQIVGNEVINIAGTGVGTGYAAGALVNNGGDSTNAVRFLRLTADATIGSSIINTSATGRFDVRDQTAGASNNGLIDALGEQLDLGGFTLTKEGLNQFSAVGVDMTVGTVNVNRGLFGVELSTPIRPGTVINVGKYGVLGFFQPSASLGLNVGQTGIIQGTLNVGGGFLQDASSGGIISSAVNIDGTHGGVVANIGTLDTFNGNISGVGNLTKVGGGRMVLNTPNAGASGRLNVMAGVVDFGDSLVSGLSANAGGWGGQTMIAGGGTLRLTRGTDFTLANTQLLRGTLQILPPLQTNTVTLGSALGTDFISNTLQSSQGQTVIGSGAVIRVGGYTIGTTQLTTNNIGTVSITAGADIVTGSGEVGGATGAGIVNQTGGTWRLMNNDAADGTLRIGNLAGVESQYNISGGTLLLPYGAIGVGQDGIAPAFNITGGLVQAFRLNNDTRAAAQNPFSSTTTISGGDVLIGQGGLWRGGATLGTQPDVNYIGGTIGAWGSMPVTVPSANFAFQTLNIEGQRTFDTNGFLMSLGSIQGPGGLTKADNGVLFLSSTGLYTGPTNVDTGVVRIGNPGAFGLSSAVNIASGATVDFNGQNQTFTVTTPASATLSRPIVNAAGSGVLGQAAVWNGGAAITNLPTFQTLNLTADASMGGVNRYDLVAAGVNFGGFKFTKVGVNELWYAPTSNTGVAAIDIVSGRLGIQSSGALGTATAPITVFPGGELSSFATNTNNKALVLAGGFLSNNNDASFITWSGGLTLTANSWVRFKDQGSYNLAINRFIVLNNANLDLNGFSLTKFDRSSLEIRGATGTGNGDLNLLGGITYLTSGTVINGTGALRIAADAALVLDGTNGAVSVARTVTLNGGLLANAAGNHTAAAVVNGYGRFSPAQANGTTTLTLSSLTLGNTATTGLFFNTTSTTTITGTLPTINAGMTAGTSDATTSFAALSGSNIVAVTPTLTTSATGPVNLSSATATDTVLATHTAGGTVAHNTISADLKIVALIAERDVQATGNALLTLNSGGLISRANPIIMGDASVSGRLTSGEAQGRLFITTAGTFEASQALNLRFSVVDNPLAPGCFQPVTLIKDGLGSLQAMGDNGTAGTLINSTFTGGMIINSGRVMPRGSNGVGFGNISVADGGQLALIDAQILNGVAFANNVSINGLGASETGAFGALRLSGLTGSVVTGTVNLASTARIHNATTDGGIVAGLISGSGTLQKTGANQVLISNPSNTYTGATQLGYVDLAGGVTTVAKLANGGANSSIGTSSNSADNLVINGATLRHQGLADSTDRLFTIGLNGAALESQGWAGMNWTNTGALAVTPGSTRTLSFNGDVNVAINNISNGFSPANIFAPVISDPAHGFTNIVKNGSSTWVLTGNNTGNGAVSVTNGILQVGNGGTTGSLPGAGTPDASIGLGNVSLSNQAKLVFNRSDDIVVKNQITGGSSVNQIVQAGSGTLTLAGIYDNSNFGLTSGVALRVDNGILVLAKEASAGAQWNSGKAVSSGTGTLGANHGIMINAGTLRLGGAANAPDQISDFTDVYMRGGTFDMNGRADTIGRLEGTGGTVTGGGTLGVGSSANNSQSWIGFNGTIAGGTSLVKFGTNSIMLRGNSTADGGATINQGRLMLGFNGSTGSIAGGIQVNAAGTLSFNRSDNATFANVINGNSTGTIENLGSASATLTGMPALAYTPLAVRRGTLNLALTGANTKLQQIGGGTLDGGTLKLTGNASGTSEFLIDNGITLAGGNIIVDGNGAAGTDLRLTAFTRGTGAATGSVNFGAINGGAIRSNTLNDAGIISTAQHAYATYNGNDWAAQLGDSRIGAFTAYQNNVYTAGTHTNVTTTAFTGPATTGTLRFANAAPLNLALGGSTLSLNKGGILFGSAIGSNAVTISAGTIVPATLTPVDARGADLIIHQHNTSQEVVISAVLGNPVGAAATQNGTNTAGVAVLTGLASTANLYRGMPVSGGTIPAGSFINSVDSGTQITLNQTIAAVNTAVALTFGGYSTGLVKAGDGTLRLTGTNTFNGALTVNGGKLIIGDGTTNGSIAGPINTAIQNPFVNDAILAWSRSDTVTVGAIISGFGEVRQEGTGILSLNATNSFAGGLTVAKGTVTTNNATGFGGNNATGLLATQVTLGDAITGADNIALLVNHTAALTVPHHITVSALGSGTVTIGSQNNVAAINAIFSGAVELNRPTIFGGNLDRTSFVGTISGNVGTLTIANTSGGASGRVTIENENNFTATDININDATILQVGSGAFSDPRNQLPDNVKVNLLGAGAATFQLNGDSETIGQLNSTNVNALVQSIAAGPMALTINNGGTYNGQINGNAGGGLIIEATGGTLSIGGTLDNNTGRVLVNGGIVELNKTSSGSVHAIGGSLVVNSGTLRLAGTGGDQIYDGGLNAGTGVPVVVNGGTFDLNGQSEGIGALIGLGGTVTNTAASTTSTLTLGVNHTSGPAYYGNVQDGAGAVAITKVGNGGAVFAGNNTFTGTTTISGGYLQIGVGGTTGTLAGTSGVTTSTNTQLVINRSDAVTIAPVISGGGALLQNGTGKTSLTSDNTLTGPVVINGGSLFAGNGGATGSFGSGNVTISAGTVAGIDHGSNAHVTPNSFGGAGGLEKQSSGVETITGKSTYTGTTDLKGGTLLLGGNDLLLNTAPLKLSTGTTLATGGFSDTTGALSVNGNAIFDMGAGSTSILTFGDVAAWTGMLQVWNYDGTKYLPGSDKLLFTAGTANINLANVSFFSDSGNMNIGTAGALIGNELVPVPEPSAIMSLLALFGLAGYKERRRFFHFRK